MRLHRMFDAFFVGLALLQSRIPALSESERRILTTGHLVELLAHPSIASGLCMLVELLA